MARYRHTGITLRDLRIGATETGEPTREGDPMTLVFAAKRLHCSQPHLSNIERGRDKASPKLLARMRTLYGVPLEVVYAAHATSLAQALSDPRKPRRAPK